MKKLLLIFGIILTINSYSQISFEKGYYIDNSGQKKECFIKNEDWSNSPINFKYKSSENEDIKTNSIDSVKEFTIYNVSKYIRKTVQIDLSSENIDNLSNDKNPVFSEKQLFLKVLIEGKANLYEAGNLKKYFYNVDNSNIEQLIFKSYKNLDSDHRYDSDNQIVVNYLFRKQLWDNLKCSTIKMDDLKKLDYKKNSLISVFSEYNKCSNSEFINYEVKQQRDAFNLTLKARLNSSSLSIQKANTNAKEIDFDKKTGFGFGFEAEFILPFNKNKWALLIDPGYQSFNGEKTINDIYLAGETITAEVKYTSFEIPLGVRHYFFLNKNSKLFINAFFVYDLALDSAITFKRSNGSLSNSLPPLEIDNSNNFSFGIGYKLYNKYNLELRYNTTRDFLTTSKTWSSDYKTISIILGYTIF